MRWEVKYEILNEHIIHWLDTSDCADRMDAKFLSTKAFMGPLADSIQSGTCKAVSGERLSTNMEKQLEGQTLDAQVKRIMQKSVSPP